MDRIMSARWLAALLCGVTGLGSAQALPDPTRPPAQLAPGAPPAGAASAIGSSRPVLQSVLIGRAPNGRRVAVIDGQTVRVGEKINGAVLTGVSDYQAVLLRGGERLVLRLYPGGALTSDAPDASTHRSPPSR